MSWTDERVERLSKLWLEGRSASQIATDLGLGVSRNAVIGKVHRLGLSGRAGRGADAAPAGETVDADPSPAVPAPVEAVASGAAMEPGVAAAKGPAEVVAMTDRVTILDLRETMCRWPLGDPTSVEFRFCGCRASPGLPYCATHARVAFQPVAERRRVERFARLA